MNPYLIHDTVSEYLEAQWYRTAIREPGKDQDKPPLPYIEPWFLPGGVFGLEIGGAAERVGVFKINIFTKKGAGLRQGEYYGGLLEAMFWHQTINGIWFENDSIMPKTEWIGIDQALQANHHQTTIPFSVIWEN